MSKTSAMADTAQEDTGESRMVLHPARPITVPLADAALFKHYTGLSPDRARKLHLAEGFPLRARGTGARRSWYAVLDDVARWWAKQRGE